MMEGKRGTEEETVEGLGIGIGGRASDDESELLDLPTPNPRTRTPSRNRSLSLHTDPARCLAPAPSSPVSPLSVAHPAHDSLGTQPIPRDSRADKDWRGNENSTSSAVPLSYVRTQRGSHSHPRPIGPGSGSLGLERTLPIPATRDPRPESKLTRISFPIHTPSDNCPAYLTALSPRRSSQSTSRRQRVIACIIGNKHQPSTERTRDEDILHSYDRNCPEKRITIEINDWPPHTWQAQSSRSTWASFGSTLTTRSDQSRPNVNVKSQSDKSHPVHGPLLPPPAPKLNPSANQKRVSEHASRPRHSLSLHNQQSQFALIRLPTCHPRPPSLSPSPSHSSSSGSDAPSPPLPRPPHPHPPTHPPTSDPHDVAHPDPRPPRQSSVPPVPVPAHLLLLLPAHIHIHTH